MGEIWAWTLRKEQIFMVAPLIKGLCCLKFAYKWALALCYLYCQSGFAVLQFVPLVLPVKESPLWCNAEKLPLVYSWLKMSKVASSTSRGGKFSEKDHWHIEMNFCQQWTQPFPAVHLALFYQYCTLFVFIGLAETCKEWLEKDMKNLFLNTMNTW